MLLNPWSSHGWTNAHQLIWTYVSTRLSPFAYKVCMDQSDLTQYSFSSSSINSPSGLEQCHLETVSGGTRQPRCSEVAAAELDEPTYSPPEEPVEPPSAAMRWCPTYARELAHPTRGAAKDTSS